MSPELLKLYHSLPPQVRSWAASLWGYKLRHWRYSGDFDKLVEEIQERDSWSHEQWKAFREERLAFILDRAVKRVPYYRNLWEERRRKGDKSSHELLENWPVLDKEIVRQNTDAFVADDMDRKQMYHEHTSGTTGKALSLWDSRDTIRYWYAMFEVRSRYYYGVSRFQRYGSLGGQIVVPVEQNKPPYWVWNSAFRQLYMSTYHMSPKTLPLYLNMLKKYRIEFLYGYSYMLYVLAQGALDLGRDDIRLKVAISNAEIVKPQYKEAVEKAFGCKLRETYAASEFVVSAGECEHGNMHLWPDVGILEVLDNNHQAVPDGDTGNFICTGLVNPDMILVRYDIGDRGAVKPKGETCACGRHMQMLQQIDGRANDKLVTNDGRVVFQFDPVVYNLPLKEAQIVQKQIGEVLFRFVPGEGWSGKSEQEVRDRINSRLGKANIQFEELEYIPVEKNGKFRMVVCDVSEEEIRQAQQS